MKVGIVGYGKMGRGIFSLFRDSPMEVTVLDVDPAEMDRQNRRLEKRLRRAAASGMLSEAELASRLASIRFTTSWDDLGDCDLVIETVFENWDTKIEVLRRAERTVSPQAVVTSNTSSLPITQMADSLQEPSRFCGYHFFHPIQLTTVVEILTTKSTAPATVDFLRQVSQDVGRTPLVMKDEGGGSCINVVLTCHTCEALYLLEQGLMPPSQIDTLCGRFARIGPCEGLDVVGIPFFADVLERMLKVFPFHLVVPELLDKLIRDGRHGKQVGQGIYLYRDDKPVDDAMDYYVDPCQSHSPSDVRSDEVGLYERLLFPIYFSVLKVAQMGLGEVGDLCLGIMDLIGMKIDPLEEMRKLGSDGLRDVFDRLRHELGPRYDASPLEDVMARLDGDC